MGVDWESNDTVSNWIAWPIILLTISSIVYILSIAHVEFDKQMKKEYKNEVANLSAPIYNNQDLYIIWKKTDIENRSNISYSEFRILKDSKLLN